MQSMKFYCKNIEALASQILYHKALYYKGKSEITNEEFDALEDELKKLNPHHPVLQFVGYSLAHQKNKVAHKPLMLSLAKTYEKSIISVLYQNNFSGIDPVNPVQL